MEVANQSCGYSIAGALKKIIMIIIKSKKSTKNQCSSKANFVSTLWECVSDDSGYSGLYLSFEIMLKALTA